jgi:hypothetical protein
MKSGEVLKVKRGRYVHPDRADLPNEATISTPRQNGQKIRKGDWKDPEIIDDYGRGADA